MNYKGFWKMRMIDGNGGVDLKPKSDDREIGTHLQSKSRHFKIRLKRRFDILLWKCRWGGQRFSFDCRIPADSLAIASQATFVMPLMQAAWFI